MDNHVTVDCHVMSRIYSRNNLQQMKPKEEKFLVDWINIVQNGITFVEKVGVMLIPSVACGT